MAYTNYLLSPHQGEKKITYRNWPGEGGRPKRQHNPKQLGELLYDVEWNNGTSFYYTLGEDAACEIMEFEVGIPRSDFLYGADYLGTKVIDGFLCNIWEKVEFIWYYEDVLSQRPVGWDFYDVDNGTILEYVHQQSVEIRVFLRFLRKTVKWGFKQSQV
ncbi:hypothetical protein RJ639_018994 [Escallonia herrerae]|uniref:Uncharacterized protein n=1 Tax=Escallonia herrerae TaxID=1293975 RepID=A0AA89AI54_9ASTE|nr:hypothetical protein RJ639_018994 [Escallonia herrerae]